MKDAGTQCFVKCVHRGTNNDSVETPETPKEMTESLNRFNADFLTTVGNNR